MLEEVKKNWKVESKRLRLISFLWRNITIIEQSGHCRPWFKGKIIDIFWELKSEKQNLGNRFFLYFITDSRIFLITSQTHVEVDQEREETLYRKQRFHKMLTKCPLWFVLYHVHITIRKSRKSKNLIFY